MGILDRLAKWKVEWSARKFGKGCARAMLFSAMILKEQYEDTAPTYAWLAMKALSARPYWRPLNENKMLYTRTNEIIDISDDMSVADVTDLVIQAEMEWYVSSMPFLRRVELTELAHREALNYFSRK